MLSYSRAAKYVCRALTVFTWLGKCGPVKIFVYL